MLESDLLHWLTAHLVRFGPGVLFFVCLLETAIFAGLILPVGGLIAFSAMLSFRGIFDPAEVAMAALGGAFIGDQLGFVVGRWFVARAQPPRGQIAALWAGAIRRAEALLRARGLIGISLSRTIPFVRTIMPWFAGRSGLPWSRFLLFDLVGILLWGGLYIGGGFLAGEGWRHLAGYFGELAAAAFFLALLLLTILLARRSTRRRVEGRAAHR